MLRLREPEPALLRILHEDANLLVVNKPAGLVCHPTKGAAFSSLVGRLRLHLGASGGAALHLVHRLDRETSGIVLAAKDRETAGELGRLVEQRTVLKEYRAIVHGHLATDAGAIEAPLGKDVHSAIAIKDCVRPDGAPARTEYSVVRPFVREGRPYSLVKVVLRTGRKHQIRLHLAHLGHPVVGDKIYGGNERLYLDFIRGALTPDQERELILPHHALHAARLSFCWRGRSWEFCAEPEPWFAAFSDAPRR